MVRKLFAGILVNYKCLHIGIITFVNWKGTLKIVDREFLTQEEIQVMLEKEINNERLDLVKDIFIFCCYTGLAYADVKKLSRNDLVIGIDGNK